MTSLQRYLFYLSWLLLCSTLPLHAFSLDVLSLTTNLGAAVSAGAELFEDTKHVGHGHGILLLTGSRLCREMNVLRESLADECEDLEKTPTIKRAVKRFLHVITNPTFAMFLSGCGSPRCMGGSGRRYSARWASWIGVAGFE